MIFSLEEIDTAYKLTSIQDVMARYGDKDKRMSEEMMKNLQKYNEKSNHNKV